MKSKYDHFIRGTGAEPLYTSEALGLEYDHFIGMGGPNNTVRIGRV